VYSAAIYSSSPWEPTKVVGGEMDAVAHKAISAIFKSYPKNGTEKVLFGDVGLLPPSLTIHLSKLVWLRRIKQLLKE
jgi:hypothetical protein